MSDVAHPGDILAITLLPLIPKGRICLTTPYSQSSPNCARGLSLLNMISERSRIFH